MMTRHPGVSAFLSEELHLASPVLHWVIIEALLRAGAILGKRTRVRGQAFRSAVGMGKQVHASTRSY